MARPKRKDLTEIGYQGIRMYNGVTQSELTRELNFPNNKKTYKQMSQHPSINAPLSLYDNLISKVSWRIIPPVKATEEEKKQSEFVEQCLHDMDVTFRQVIRDALTSNIYGFAVLEKVYRYRKYDKGSKYNDGKVGLKKLGLRHQESIHQFLFDSSGNNVTNVVQRFAASQNGNLINHTTDITIPRDKFMLVSVGRNSGDPYGKSPLRDVYLAWRYLTVIEEIEAAGAAKDLAGLPILTIPAQYMSADASDDQKAMYEQFKNIVRNIQQNSQSGIILPSATDPDTKQPLFGLKLLSAEGAGKNFDTEKIKQYYQNQIFVGLSADVLILGTSGVGSFALGQVKSSLTGSAVESMLDTIVDAFNRDVIRQIYELNGWDVARCGSLDYSDLHAQDLETLSKGIQRFSSTGMLELDRDVLNAVRTSIGVDPKPVDAPVDKENLTGNTSRSGDGLKTAGEGTSTSVSGGDTSSDNLENTA